MKSTIKVFAVGNSFAEDGVEWLYPILKELGYDDITIGNAYIGGCSLERHANNISSDAPLYRYWLNTDGEWHFIDDVSLKRCLLDKDWEIVTFQQVSGLSGIKESFYPWLNKAIDGVDEILNHKKIIRYWHKTWSYPKSSDWEGLKNYGTNRIMDEKITKCVKELILTDERFVGVIYSGDVIRGLKDKGYPDDVLYRDGGHLSQDVGRFSASLAWAQALTGKSVKDVKFLPPTAPKKLTKDVAEILEKIK